MFVGLMLIWLVFNGRVTVEILCVGAVVSAALTFAWSKLFNIKKNRILVSPRALWRYVSYTIALIIEIISCNIRVMHLVLHPKEEIRPQLMTFRVDLESDVNKVVLANSITLTPGTVTVGQQGNMLRVHALDASFMEGIEDSDMIRRLKKMEEKK